MELKEIRSNGLKLWGGGKEEGGINQIIENKINSRSIRQQNNFPKKAIEAIASKLFRMRRDKSARRLMWTNQSGARWTGV